MKLTYYKSLDGVRAIAAFMVMIFHFFNSVDLNEAQGLLAKITAFGQTGVDLFFVLSGFLITRILIQTKNTKGYFKNFYLRRVLRIFPLYYLFLILTFYILPPLFELPNSTLSQQIYHLTYLQNFAATFNWNFVGPGHFWSLAIEEHFYLFWPLIVCLFSIKNLTRIIFWIVIVALCLRVLMINSGYEVFYFTFTRFDALAIGSFLAIIELKGLLKERNAKKFVVLMLVLLVPMAIIWTVFRGEGNKYIQAFRYLFFSGVYFSVIGFVLCIKENNIINKCLRTKVFTYTGKISYGLYVFHPLTYSICDAYFQLNNIGLNFIVCILFTYLIASFSFYFFESLFLKLKKYFEYGKKTTVG